MSSFQQQDDLEVLLVGKSEIRNVECQLTARSTQHKMIMRDREELLGGGEQGELGS